MIFVKIGDKNTIEMIHHMPFDNQHGLGKTKEELDKEGYLVDEYPVPEDNGKKAELKFNQETQTLYYEYHDFPLTTEDELSQVKEDMGNILFESAADKAKIASLEATTGDLLFEMAILKLGGNA